MQQSMCINSAYNLKNAYQLVNLACNHTKINANRIGCGAAYFAFF